MADAANESTASSSLEGARDKNLPNLNEEDLSPNSKCSGQRKQVRYRWHTWITESLGFQPEQLLTWSDLTRLLHRPCDPASLAATRIMFGVLMILDLPQERGMGMADQIWGDPSICHFPLFDEIKPLPLRWMMLIYATMIVCSVMMVLGWKWRSSCGIFVTFYWYLFLLDKATWNNHSYLYGLLSSIMLFSDPHRCWSVDSMNTPNLKNSHVPLWSYALLRMQVFLLYFFAGLKKIDVDWLYGYSMQQLSERWVFFPFRLMLSNDIIDFYLIHLGGFTLDLTIGFLLFFDKTRNPALFFGMAFHLMNSQIFSIGMFPWMCMATMPIFCKMSWPRSFISSAKTLFMGLALHCMNLLEMVTKKAVCNRKKNIASTKSRTTDIKTRRRTTTTEEGDRDSRETEAQEGTSLHLVNESLDEARKVMSLLQRNPNCCYSGSDTITWKQKITTLAVLLYVSLQLFLPFSHFITKGYNTWTEGPYGYSWDMMVHSWDTLHIKITAVNKETQEQIYLDPSVWTKNNRWASHVDMAVQFSSCIEDRLMEFGISNFSLHFDVWRSLNRRFQQRVYDPHIDILEAPWSPWRKTPWVLPMLSEFSPWRNRLRELQQIHEEISLAADAIFIADFPGLILENFLSEELSNTTLEVLQGEVAVLMEMSPETDQCLNLGTVCYDQYGVISKQLRNSNNTEATRGSRIHTKRKIFGRREGSAIPTGTKQNVIYKIALGVGEKIPLPTKSLHKVITTSHGPSSFMYTFINATLERMINESKEGVSETEISKSNLNIKNGRAKNVVSTIGYRVAAKTCKNNLWFLEPKSPQPGPKKASKKTTENKGTTDNKDSLRNQVTESHDVTLDLPTWHDFVHFFTWKSKLFKRSGQLLIKALISIVTGGSMDQI